MRNVKLLGFAVIALSLGITTAIPNSVNRAIEQNDARIIVKFKMSPKQYSQDEIIQYQNQAIASIKGFIAPGAKTIDRYTNLLNGVVLDIPSAKVNAVRGLSFVSAVDYDTLHHIEQGDGGITIQRSGEGDPNLNDNISAETMNVPDNTKKGEGILIGILDSGFLLNHKDEATNQYYTHETYSPLPANIKTKLSKADVDVATTQEGFHGKAIDVDSLYFNNKVPYYFDYGGAVTNYNDYSNHQNIVMDNDVFSPLSDHGLHVSSLAAGNGPDYKGIAPNAQLALFKVFTEYYPTADDKKKGYSDSSGAFDSAVIKALEDAAILKVDVLNMSFGSNLNDFEEDSIVNQLLKELRENGIWANYSAGNAGKGYFNGTSYGGWTLDMIDTGIISDASNEESVMTVGANQADREYFEQAIEINGRYISYTDQVISSSSTKYNPERYLTDFVTPGSTKDWIKIPNFGEAADYNGLDVTNKVAIVDRGSTTFADKVDQAYKKGAGAICIINNSTEAVSMSFGTDANNNPITPAIPVALIAYEDRNNFEAGSGKMSLISNVYVNNVTARQMATFSSDGATYDYRIKPDITAPGHLVKGAVSENDAGEVIGTATNTYDYWSGTSMASPNYAGAVALLLGEHTVNQGGKLVIDPDYLASVNARTMSTADQLDDRYGLDASVRIQGAGMVNVKAALDSEVFFESTKDSGKAKIELKNNADIANGVIKLSFLAHNQGEAKTFNAKIKVYRPTVYRYQRRDTSKESPSINNVELQAITNTLITEVNTVVNIPAGESTINLDTITLDAATKQYIEEHFEAACPIEGYVVLTNNHDPRLSIPFLGYYGDVSSAMAVEPFNFEKVAGKTYPSTLVNNVMRIMGFDKGDFSSDMAVGYFDAAFYSDDEEEDDSSVSPLSDWLYNKGDLTSIKNSNGGTFSKMKTYKNADGSYSLHVQNNNNFNSIVIQQYVMRSIMDNDLTITKKSNNEVILRDHMFDTLWGDENNHTLAKSFALDKYLSNGITGHRAYTILGLFDHDTGEVYPDGEYEIEFEYELTDGSRQNKKYDLVIDNASPTVVSVEARGDYLRVRYGTASAMGAVTVGGVTVLNPKKDELGFYVDISKDEIKNGRIFFVGNNVAGRGVNAIAHFDDPDGLIVANQALTTAHNFVVNKASDGNTLSYTISYLRNNAAATVNGNKFITLNIPEGYDPNDVTVIDFDSTNVGVETPFTVYNHSIRFQTQNSRFDIVFGEAITLSSLQVTSPSKTIYAVNENLDTSDLLVVGKYSDDSIREINNFSVSNVDMGTPGQKVVTVSYLDKSATFNITVVNEALTALIVKSLPNKTVYQIGETFDPTGLVINSITNTNKIGVVSDYVLSEVDMLTEGSKLVDVTFDDLTISFAITVLKASVASINVTKMGKIVYEEGEALDLSGFAFAATYSDGSTQAITDYRVLGFNANKAGKQKVIISFGGKTVVFEVTVNQKTGPVDPNPDSSSTIPSTSSNPVVSSEVPGSSSVGSSAPSTEVPRDKGCFGSITASLSLMGLTAVLGLGYILIKSKKKVD